MNKSLPLLVLAFVLIFIGACDHPSNPKKTLVILSMDGFRWDYPELASTPHLDLMAEIGVKAVSLRPSFPTKTFPNHYTMATGLYPDHHGIVQNSFYDPQMDRSYAIFDRNAVMDGSFYGGEPLWVTAEKQGRAAYTLFWVGTEAPVQGVYASKWSPYEEELPFEQRIDSVINWLSLPEESRPELIMWYFHEPDGSGHHYGPESQGNMQVVTYLDSLLGVFLSRLETIPHKDQIDFIVTSDHGMAANDSNHVVYLTDHIDTAWFSVIEGYNPNYLFMVKDASREEAEQGLNNVPNVSVWPSGEVPGRLHYGSNPRTMDYVLVADSGWAVHMERGKQMAAGAHGYDNRNTDMHTIFYAIGPSFKSGYSQPTFDNVDLYPLACRIIGLEPAPNDGTLENVEDMLIIP